MSVTIKSSDVNNQASRSAHVPQIKVHCGVRAGGASGPCDIAYWRTELNYWRKLAEQMGCA
jgi:hypothetical protein